MKAIVAAFNQEKALVEAFSVLTNLRMELFQALPPWRLEDTVSSEPSTEHCHTAQNNLLSAASGGGLGLSRHSAALCYNAAIM